MRLSLLPLLACPDCGGEIRFSALERFPGLEHDIETGTLACAACGAEFAIREGIPRLRPGARTGRAAEKTRRSFAWEWLRYPGPRSGDRGIFLEETMLPPAELAGKRVLDAGCGMGRYGAVALELGAEVIAVDVSDALIRVAERAKTQPKLHPVEGDLLRPPFKKGAFDIVYSQGVLHHTADTHAAFRAVATLVKPRGLLSVWLYGKAGRFAEFATNPLRDDRGWAARHRRLAWAVVLVRHVISDFLRAFTTRLPIPLMYALCYPLTWLGAAPGVKYLTFSVDPDFRVRLSENFDWISPPHQWHHTKEQLLRWYEEEGFTVLKLLAHGLVPKPGAIGRRIR